MKLHELTTERRNRATENLDTMTALEVVEAMNREDAAIPRAIKRVLPTVAKTVDIIANCLANGGRLIYVGSGTSGRIGALDASECPPTFNTSPDMVQYLIAGGDMALTQSVEGSEDSAELGRSDMEGKNPTSLDVVVGVAASGCTPYTISALEFARSRGAVTVAISCNLDSALGSVADIPIEVEVGPEVLTGSSRLKAGTAQKQICNMLTTGAMARMGYVYSNLMVNLHLTNKKLLQRGIVILESLAGVSQNVAMQFLENAEMSVPLALVMLKANATKPEAIERLRKSKGNVRKAIEG
jgi:N-acetylmuramic acid 6-phosphate etherase